MRKWLVVFLVIILVLGTIWFFFGSSWTTKKQAIPHVTQSNQQPSTDIPQVSIVAENLSIPWAIAFLPDHSMLVTERPGRVRLIDATGKLQDAPVATLADVKEIGEGGLLGIALDPDFPKNHYVYLYYTYAGTNDTLNRVARYTYQNNALIDAKILVDAIPGNSNHNGGRIKFGSDNLLYITTGDAEEPSRAQDKNSLGGKILRITTDGKAAPGNAFNNLVYSYGHRNPQGLAWDNDGRLWATEHGRSGVQSGLDEINLIVNGNNYGWPTIQGTETRAGMQTPFRNSGNTTWAPAGVAYYNGRLFFGGLRGQTLYEAVLENDKIVDLKTHLAGEFGRIREVILGPDNMLYITTSNRDGRGVPQSGDDKVLKVNPAKL